MSASYAFAQSIPGNPIPMPAQGFILLPREMLDHPAVFARGESLCSGHALTWLISAASWNEREVTVEGKRLRLGRGQMSFSTRFLAEAWGWTQVKVRRFLKRLAGGSLIDLADGSPQTVITICDYEKYVARKPNGGSPADPPAVAQVAQIRTKNHLDAAGAAGDPEDAHPDAHPGADSDKPADPAAETTPPVPTPAPRPPDPDKPAPEVLALVAAFNASAQACWPRLERMPRVADQADAKRWLEAAAAKGIGPGQMIELCTELFREKHQRMAAKQSRPPITLSFHEDRVIEALHQWTRPLGDHTPNPDATLFDRFNTGFAPGRPPKGASRIPENENRQQRFARMARGINGGPITPAELRAKIQDARDARYAQEDEQ